MSNRRRCSHRRHKKSDDKLNKLPNYINLIIAILNLLTAILLKLDNGANPRLGRAISPFSP